MHRIRAFAAAAISVGTFASAAYAQDHTAATAAAAARQYTARPVTAAEAAAWRADLRALTRGMESIHPNLYHAIAPARFDSAVRALDARIPALAAHEIIVELARLVALIGDGHTSLALYFARGVDFHALPVRFGIYDDGVFIEAADRSYAGIVGGRVTAVGGVPVDSALARLEPLISRDNDNWLPAVLPNLLNRIEVLHALRLTDRLDRAAITIEKNGRVQTTVLVPLSAPVRAPMGLPFLPQFTSTWVDARDSTPGPAPLYLQRFEQRYFSEHLASDDILYIKWDQVQNAAAGETAIAFFRRALDYARERKPSKTVIDIRNNTGGEGNLLPAIVREIVRTREVDEPGRLFVVIGRRTFSAAQILATDLETYTSAIFVGEPTGSRPNVYAGHQYVHLPHSGIGVAVSPHFYQSGWPHDTRREIRPRLAAVPTFAHYVSNRDPALEVIRNYRADARVADSLYAYVAQHDTTRALQLVRTYDAEPVNRFTSAASDVNAAAYRLLNENRLDEALWLFRANVSIHPSYANGWDSLGEALVRAGRNEEAIAAFRRALQLDPQLAPAIEWLRRLGGGGGAL